MRTGTLAIAVLSLFVAAAEGQAGEASPEEIKKALNGSPRFRLNVSDVLTRGCVDV